MFVTHSRFVVGDGWNLRPFTTDITAQYLDIPWDCPCPWVPRLDWRNEIAHYELKFVYSLCPIHYRLKRTQYT